MGSTTCSPAHTESKPAASVRPAGIVPLTSHDVPVDFVITPERIIDCRARHGPRPVAGICWEDLTEEKIAAIPLLSAQRARQ